MTATTASKPATATATTSPTRPCVTCDEAASRPAAASGTAIGSGTRISSSASHWPQAVRVERADALLGLDRKREQERGDGHADDDVRQRKRLDNGIDRLRPLRHVGVDRSGPALSIADRE